MTSPLARRAVLCGRKQGRRVIGGKMWPVRSGSEEEGSAGAWLPLPRSPTSRLISLTLPHLDNTDGRVDFHLAESEVWAPLISFWGTELRDIKELKLT